MKEQVDPSKTLADERREWDEFGATLQLAPDVAATTMDISGVPCLWLKPKDAGNTIILYAHGGGLTAGSILTHRAYASHLASETRCQLVLADYRRLPENPLHAPSNDFVKVYCDVLEHHPDAQIVFGADSAGGAVSVAALCKLRDSQIPLPAGSFVLSGAFDATLSSDSHHANEPHDPLLSAAALAHWQTQLGKDIDLCDPLISPLFGDLRRLPPHLLLAGGIDLWRDDTLRFADRLKRDGCQCESQIFAAMWHVWPMSGAMPETNAAFAMIARFIKSLNSQRTIAKVGSIP